MYNFKLKVTFSMGAYFILKQLQIFDTIDKEKPYLRPHVVSNFWEVLAPGSYTPKYDLLEFHVQILRVNPMS